VTQAIETAGLDELVSRYAEAAAGHKEATAEGDHRRANREHDRVAEVYRELRRRGPEAQRALLPLLEHPIVGVRSWAGAHALEFAPEEGEHALSRIVADGGMPGFTAKTTLDTWRKGELRFP
jgi:hypothetical protein